MTLPQQNEPTKVTMTLSRQAAVFLGACVEHMNQKKILPADNAQALETSAWLEEIGAAANRAAPGGDLAELVDAYAHLEMRLVSAQMELVECQEALRDHEVALAQVYDEELGNQR